MFVLKGLPGEKRGYLCHNDALRKHGTNSLLNIVKIQQNSSIHTGWS